MYAPKVVNQVGAGTSSAWATIWYGQTIAKTVTCLEDDSKAITAEAYAPMYTYRMANPDGDCFTPKALSEILKVALTLGSPHFKDFNDLCPIEAPDSLQSSAYENRIDGFAKLFNPFDTRSIKISAIKKAIHSNHPVVIGMITPASFSLAKEFWQAREQPDTTMSAQALCVVGYDDQQFGGAVEVVNQWGKHWGNEGYTWIRYEDLSRFARYGYELFYSASCVPLPQTTAVIYDGRGTVLDQFDIDNKIHRVAKPVKIDTKFKMSIRAKSGFFMYLLIKEEGDKITALFPTATVHPYVTQNITLPGKDVYFQLQGMPQTNEMYLIISKRQLDVAEITGQIESASLISQAGATNNLEVAAHLKDQIHLAKIEIEQY